MDSYILRFIGKPQHGWIDLQKEEMSRFDFLYRLTRSKAPLVSLKLIPGETTYNILEKISKQFHTPFKVLLYEYNHYAPYPDGVFIPDTYYLPKGMEGEKVVIELLRYSLAKHAMLANKFFGHYNRKIWFEKIVTIASIVQKEAADAKEMPLIAAVIYNRLKKGMPLQMDGALNYGKYSHTKVTKKRILSDDSPFNTYRHKGLPPYPVCIVSMDALKAALKPAKVSYLYFVKGSRGRHLFSRSYQQHLRYLKDVKKRNR